MKKCPERWGLQLDRTSLGIFILFQLHSGTSTAAVDPLYLKEEVSD